MKLLRYGPRGAELPGILDSQHRIRSLIRHIPDIGPTQISSANLRMLSSIDTNTLPIINGNPFGFIWSHRRA